MNISLLNVDIFGEVTKAIKSWFFGILYSILKALLYIVDICEMIVRKLAGIESYYYNGQLINGTENTDTVTGDIIEIILRTDIVRNLFLSLLVLGVILLLIVTFVSIWKTEWNFDKEGNSKTKILNSALKSLFNFIAVPVIAFFGIFVGNALLRAIDSATRGGDSQTFSTFVMSSAFANACKEDGSWVEANKNSSINIGTKENPIYRKGILSYFCDSEGKLHTDEVIKAFQVGSGTEIPKGEYIIVEEIVDGIGITTYYRDYNKKLDNGTFAFSYEDATLVTTFFDNTKINYLPLYLIMVFIIKAMLSITFGLIKRLYYVVILFVISPPVVAMAPINEKALNDWKKSFSGNVCSAFITIAIYNIFLSIYPMFQNITLFSSGSSSFYSLENFFVQLLFIAVGLQAIAGLTNEIAAMFGVKSLEGSKDSWAKTFGLAGSALRPASAITGATIGALGSAGKFMSTARYHGLGEAAKGLGDDVKGAAGRMKGAVKGAYDKSVLKNFNDSAKLPSVKPLGSAMKFKKESGILDQYKTLRGTNKNATKDFRRAKKEFKKQNLYDNKENKWSDQDLRDLVRSDWKYKGIKAAQEVKIKYENLENLDESQQKELDTANKILNSLSLDDLKTARIKNDFVDAYDNASKTGGFNAWTKKSKQKDIVGLIQNAKAKQELNPEQSNRFNGAMEAIIKQQAKDEVKKELAKERAKQKKNKGKSKKD